MWHYTQTTAGPRLTHPAGTVPPRPLEVGDTLTYDTSKRPEVIVAHDDRGSLVQLTDEFGSLRCAFARPLAGDFADCITGVES